MVRTAESKTLFINVVLGIVLGILVSLIPFMVVQAILSNPVSKASEVTTKIIPASSMPIATLTFLLIPLFTISLLIANKRLALTLTGYVYLLGIIGWLIFNRNSNYLVISYQAFRNIGYLYLFAYSVVHLLIHSAAWFMHKKRRIVSVWGAVNWFVLFMLITYAYALVMWK